MTNLEKLKEVFPRGWAEFYCTVGWMSEEYKSNKTIKTNYDIFEEVFGQTTGNSVAAPNDFWDKPYIGDYKE